MRKSKVDSEKLKCSVTNCNQASKRSVSLKKLKDALPDLKFNETGKRIHLCKEHYKEFKKATKSERNIERLTWD